MRGEGRRKRKEQTGKGNERHTRNEERASSSQGKPVGGSVETQAELNFPCQTSLCSLGVAIL